MPNVYDVFDVLGEGGQAQVRLIRERTTLKVYAGKFLREKWDPSARQRFKEEGLRQARVAGPGVVPVVDFNFDCETPFLVLEYMPRGCLAEELKNRRSFPILEALCAAREIAAALSHLHAKGVIHRDVKPANVLRDGNGRLLLNDLGFGATMLVPSAVVETMFGGTPAYAAPEQRANFVAPASDVYALGITLHELITGSRVLNGSRPPAEVVPLIAAFTRGNHRERPSAFDAYHALDAVIKRVEKRQQEERKTAQRVLAFGAAFVGLLFLLK
jgi:eukaryotic-like serine/threonine-protein kinase